MAANRIEFRGNLGKPSLIVFNFDYAVEVTAGTYKAQLLDVTALPKIVNGAPWDQADIDAFRAGTILQMVFEREISAANLAALRVKLEDRWTNERASQRVINQRDFGGQITRQDSAGVWT